MVEYLSKKENKKGRSVWLLRPDTLVLLLMLLWWGINLIQAALTGLANDEAYYWYFSQHLDWGYYDHPPMVALLVRLSSWAGGYLGIRFFSTLLQPLYLWLFWHLIKPKDASTKDAVLYVLLCFSQPLLQLYGFLALPDAPLMAFTVLFLWAYKLYAERPDFLRASFVGLTVALLGYSKYHGALVVLLVLLSDVRLLRRGWTYWAGAVALCLMMPHLYWQYTHDFASFKYHLVGRNAWNYKFSFTTEYILTVLVLFNPLWLYHIWKGSVERKPNDMPLRGALLWIGGGFVGFFLLATLRGRVQPQWLLPVVFTVVAMTFRGARDSRYVRVAAEVCAVVFCVVRILAVLNPMGMKGEVWEGKMPYEKVAEVAEGRPVQFLGCYSFAAKYAYYTGGETHCISQFYARENQWQYDTADRKFAGREVMVADLGDLRGNRLELGTRQNFKYIYIDDYLPMRELRAEVRGDIDVSLPKMKRPTYRGIKDSIPPFSLLLRVYNPYPYDIVPDTAEPIVVRLFFLVGERRAPAAVGQLKDTLKAGTYTEWKQTLTAPINLEEGEHAAGISIGYRRFPSARCSEMQRIEVKHEKGELKIKGGI